MAMNKALLVRPSRLSGLLGMGIHALLGLLPGALWFVGCILYFLVTAPIERFTSIRVPYDQLLMFRVAEALGATGFVIGTLVGFLRTHRDFGFVEKYLLLFAFGGLVPVAASLLQYQWYRSDPSQFVFQDAALTTVGRSYTESERAGLSEDLRHTAALIQSVNVILTATTQTPVVSYVDPVSYWNTSPPQCRRLDLGVASNAMCVERERTATGQGGVSYSFWPVLKELPPTGEQSGFRVDLFFLTGPFRCDVPNDLSGGGGFNFLRHEQVDASKLRSCMSATERALHARETEVRRQVAVFDQHLLMPYWYFLSSSVFAFVGSDFALLEPVAFWPIMSAVGVAVFRYLYFAVLVAIFLEPVSDRRAENDSSGTLSRFDA